VLDQPDCVFCRVMFEVPAAVACAEGGRLELARRHLAVADGPPGPARLLFVAAGQPLDAERCVDARAGLEPTG